MTDEIDEDELDDILEGALDAFETTRPKPAASASTKPPAAVDNGANSNASAASRSAPDEETARAFEDALKTLGDMNLDASGDDDALAEADMKLVEEFMSSLGASLGELGLGAGGQTAPAGAPATGQEALTPNMEKLVESIVGQLLSKDVLKGPMNQMRESYTRWLPENAERLSVEELGRYSRQQQLVEEICEKYECGGDTAEIMELLSKMQETGAPPAEIMNDLSEDGAAGSSDMNGLDAANLDKMGELCGVQ